MTILAFEGPPRSGKTLRMTIEAKRFIEQGGYYPISNYHLTFCEYKPLDLNLLHEAMFDSIWQRRYRTLNGYYGKDKLLMLIDEMPSQGLDSRTPSKDENLLLGFVSMQAGKQSISIMGSAQIHKSYDLRLRWLEEFIIESEKIKEAGVVEKLRYYIWDMAKLRRRPMSYRPKVQTITMEQAARFYGLYDTYEPVYVKRLEKGHKGRG